jgi:hypothetical protein
LAVRGGTSAANAYGSHFSATRPPRLFTEYLYSVPTLRPGMNSSHTPLGMCFRMACLRRSQPLKSPTTLTLSALGAQTAKFTPVTPLTVRRWAPSFS